VIIVFCQPRTGSSLVSKIFVEHGVYCNHESHMTHGYKTYENQSLKRFVRNLWTDYNDGKEKQWGVAWEPRVSDIKQMSLFLSMNHMEDHEPWIHKTIIEFYQLFVPFEPKLVYVRRNRDSAIKSICEKQGDDDYEGAGRVYDLRMALMDKVQGEYGGVFVDTDKLVAGDMDDIRHAFDYCELELNPQIVEQCIDRKLWRH